ncbi:hypothetical protein CSC94_08565 [Zhengella mangrovi]|uniref:Uncharacterized protein n=1 Tax=Zhengella mangrovi TaxID=1982044 RepID=A0A2G1QQF6_9HYPH|nr:hypothetical protein [Zhengella mangrovi]PHP67732.1 hypothetical protein CSC94_08565 [Zhengella mangrovi]
MTRHPTSFDFRALLIVAAIEVGLAMLNSSALVSWSYDLPESRFTEPVIAAAEGWHQAMQAIGLAEPSRLVEDWRGGM